MVLSGSLVIEYLDLRVRVIMRTLGLCIGIYYFGSGQVLLV